MKFHINKKGDIAQCRAFIKQCPLKSSPHFESRNEAEEYLAEQNQIIPKPEKPRITDAKIELLNTYSFDNSKKYILKRNGEIVCYAKVYEDLDDEPVQLADIETNPKYLRQGYARELLTQIAETYNVEQVSHNGGYTPEGKAALKGLIKSTHTEHFPAGNFSSMNFVKNWDPENFSVI